MQANLRSTGKWGRAETLVSRPKETKEQIENGKATNENNNLNTQ